MIIISRSTVTTRIVISDFKLLKRLTEHLWDAPGTLLGMGPLVRRSNQSDWLCPSGETNPVSPHSSVTNCLTRSLSLLHYIMTYDVFYQLDFPFSLFSLSLFTMESNDSLCSDFSISIAGKLAPNVWHRLAQHQDPVSELGTQRASSLISPFDRPLPQYSSWQENIGPTKTPLEMRNRLRLRVVYCTS